MQEIPTVFCDADGTLASSSEEDQISPVTLDAVRRFIADGGVFVPATGRPVPSAWRVARTIGATWAVALGGAAIVRVSDGRVVWAAEPIPRDTLEAIWDDYGAIGARLHVHGANEWAVNHDDEVTGRYEQRHGMPAPHVGLPVGDVLMVEVVNGPSVLPIPGLNAVTSTTAHGHYVDLTAPGVHKGSGADRLLKLTGGSREHLWAIGDSHNDLPMMERAARAIVVGRSPSPELLRAATHHVRLNAGEGAVGSALLGLHYGEPEHLRHVQEIR